jgi:hypothetical protein
MRYTASCCATEGFDERVDRYDNIVGKDPGAVEARHRVADMLECLHQSLVRYHVPPDVLKKLNDLEDLVTELESKDILAIAGADTDGIALAIKLGLMYEESQETPHNQDERRD